MARQHRKEQQRRQQQQIQPPQVPSAVPHWMPKSQDATFALGREVNSFANMVHAVQQHREVNAEADVASKQSAPTASVQPRGARASQVTAVGFEVRVLLHLVGRPAVSKWHAVKAKQQCLLCGNRALKLCQWPAAGPSVACSDLKHTLDSAHSSEHQSAASVLPL